MQRVTKVVHLTESTPVVDYDTHVHDLNPKETIFEESHAEVLSSKTPGEIAFE